MSFCQKPESGRQKFKLMGHSDKLHNTGREGAGCPNTNFQIKSFHFSHVSTLFCAKIVLNVTWEDSNGSNVSLADKILEAKRKSDYFQKQQWQCRSRGQMEGGQIKQIVRIFLSRIKMAN